MQMLCTLPVLFIINKLLDMLNTLTKPRFQTFVKIFQGPTDRPTRLVLEAPPWSLKRYDIMILRHHPKSAIKTDMKQILLEFHELFKNICLCL